MPSVKNKEDARNKAVIRPGRVVPGSSASRTQGASALVQWGLRRSLSRGSSYVRNSQDLHPPKAQTSNQDESPQYDDLRDVLGTVWPRTGKTIRSMSSPHLVHETPMLLRSKISQGTERRVYHNLDGGRGENGHGRAESTYVRRGSQVIIQPPEPESENDAVGDLRGETKAEAGRDKKFSNDVAQGDPHSSFERSSSNPRETPKFSEMRSD
eukprot:833825-Rhodomonas_salina.1